MAEIHCWSGAGAPAAPYNSWGTAAATTETACTFASAGDTVWLAHDHADTQAGQTIAFTNGTVANPIRLICGTRTGTTSGDTGISGLATTGNTKTNNTTFTVTGGSAYVYGCIFETSYASGTIMKLNNTATMQVIYENCRFHDSGSSTATRFQCGLDVTGGGALTTLKNCVFRFGSPSQQIIINGGTTNIIGGSMYAGSNTPAQLFAMGTDSRGAVLNCAGFDFSGFANTMDLIGGSNSGQTSIIRNCKMPPGWGVIGSTGELHANTPGGAQVFQLLNYGTGDTNYKFWTSALGGRCRDNTSIYRTTGGAADETPQPYSIEMVSTVNTSWPAHPLRSLPPFSVRLPESPLVNKTVTVHVVHDGATALTNKQLWLEVEYLGTADFPLALFANDGVPVDTTAGGAAGSAQTSSGAAWTGDTGTGPNGSATWNQLTLDVYPVVPEGTGYLIATVCLANSGTATTVYVDPKIVIS